MEQPARGALRHPSHDRNRLRPLSRNLPCTPLCHLTGQRLANRFDARTLMYCRLRGLSRLRKRHDAKHQTLPKSSQHRCLSGQIDWSNRTTRSRRSPVWSPAAVSEGKHENTQATAKERPLDDLPSQPEPKPSRHSNSGLRPCHSHRTPLLSQALLTYRVDYFATSF